MKYYILYLYLFLLITGNIQAANILSLDSLVANPLDTLTIEVSINNDDAFVAFQFDVQLPDGFAFVEGSAVFAGREGNHVLMPSDQGNNKRRFVAFSPSNELFAGNTGQVMQFKIVLPASTGIFPLALSNVIVGNANSENILTGIVDGIVNVGGVNGISSGISSESLATIFPIPCTDFSALRFSQIKTGIVTVHLIELAGKTVGSSHLGKLLPGRYEFPISQLFPDAEMRPGKILFIELTTSTYSKTLKIIQ